MSKRILDGRVVIVTGGGRGIGREHCLELAAHGATVVVNDLDVNVHGERVGESPAEAVVAEIESAGGIAVADGTDVTDFGGVQSMISSTVERFGRLDAVVNNAGIVRDRMIVSMSEADWDAVIAVHVKGTFAVTKHACDHWRAVSKAGGSVTGRIVNTTSGVGLFGNAGQSAYGAAKAAIANLTVITAMEVERYGVTANAISPLAFTRMLATRPDLAAPDGDAWDRMDPGNSSPVVAWLASEESGWLTGQVLRVEGATIRRVRPWQLDELSYVSKSGERLATDEVGRALRKLYSVTPIGFPRQPLTAD